MTPEQRAEIALDQMEAESDIWAEGVNLKASIDHIAHISRLSINVPTKAKEAMIHRQKVLLDALMRQAFIEGAFRAVDFINNNRQASKDG